MNDLFNKTHAWLINGTDRQLFRRSLLLLLVLAVFVQIGLNTGAPLSYLAAFVVGVAYAYVWLELLKRFTGGGAGKGPKSEDDNPEDKTEDNSEDNSKDSPGK